ncbi:hypothetical protein [Streptomyces sp. WAC 01529]|uniref:hypothetical protein n=1 Tax=Streptomyces sp. WAC 01529 TaxID=2203205 RepID=UPI000F7360AB|nr:hypothetical protein [Streptomyces sp. WAC 01529]
MRTRRKKERAWPLHLFALLILVCAVALPGGGRATADGAGNGGLALQVNVNSRPGTGAMEPGIRVGDPVHKVYRLINRTGADLYDVRVTDPALPRGTAVTCGGRGTVAMLRGLSSTTCAAESRALPGVRAADVTAVGRIPSLNMESRARARAGYRGIGGALALAQTVGVTQQLGVIQYVVANRGDRVVHDVRVSDALPQAKVVDCGGGRPVVPQIAPGRSAVCRSHARAAPGTYVSRGFAEAGDRTPTLGRSGALVPPPRLTARSSVQFTLLAPPVQAARVQPPPLPPPRPPRSRDQAGRGNARPPSPPRTPAGQRGAPPPAAARPVSPPAAPAAGFFLPPFVAPLVPPPLLRAPAGPPLPAGAAAPPGAGAPGVGAPGVGAPGVGAPGVGAPGVPPPLGAGAAPPGPPAGAVPPPIGAGAAPPLPPGGAAPPPVPAGAAPAPVPAGVPPAPPPAGVAPPPLAAGVVPPPFVAGVAPPPLLDPGTTSVAPVQPRQAAQDVAILDGLYRPGHGPTGIGLLALLFLVILPAVLAAVLLGSRVK